MDNQMLLLQAGMAAPSSPSHPWLPPPANGEAGEGDNPSGTEGPQAALAAYGAQQLQRDEELQATLMHAKTQATSEADAHPSHHGQAAAAVAVSTPAVYSSGQAHGNAKTAGVDMAKMEMSARTGKAFQLRQRLAPQGESDDDDGLSSDGSFASGHDDDDDW
jgi:hypothetical protein